MAQTEPHLFNEDALDLNNVTIVTFVVVVEGAIN